MRLTAYPTPTIVGLLVLAAVFAGPRSGGLAQPGTPAASSPNDEWLDLAAMALTPSDLAAEGMGGYAVGFAATLSPAELAEGRARALGRSVREVRAAFGADGLRRAYDAVLEAAAGPAGPAAGPAQIEVFLEEYPDADRAAAALARNQSFVDDLVRGARTGIYTDVRMESGTRTVGPESRLIRYRGEAAPGQPRAGMAFAALELDFRVGPLIAGVALTDYSGAEPAVAVVEPLAARFRDRIDRVLAGGGPGLSTRVLRLAGSGVGTYADGYFLLGGEAVPFFGEPAAALAARTAQYAAANQTDWYVLQQAIPAGDGATAVVYLYNSFLDGFASDAAAAAAMEEWSRRGSGPGAEDLAVRTDAPDLGDGSAAVTFTNPTLLPGQRFRVARVHVRVGATVATIDLAQAGEDDPPREVVDALATAQAACLAGAGCPDPIPVPAALTAPAATPAATSGATPAP